MAKKAGEVITETMFYVLMAFTKGPMCGIEVAEYVENRTNKRVILGPATLYTILGRFEKEKWIEEIEAVLIDDRMVFGGNAHEGDVACFSFAFPIGAQVVFRL